MENIDLQARVALLEVAVNSLATAYGIRPQLATVTQALEAELRANGATDSAFRLRHLLTQIPST